MLLSKRGGDIKAHLFARPSFLSGVARLVDVLGTLNEYNSAPNGNLADFYATRADWKAVGDDMWEALRQFNYEAIQKADRATQQCLGLF
ncbi:MAG: hypothetical protein DIU68_005270 [Chloroflexota bacterium]|nr:MAG: hypothetical protein DIU68_01090 [Chloroflexota bacterium]